MLTPRIGDNLYSTGMRWGLALGVTQILGFVLALQSFLDTNMLVYSTQNSDVGGYPTQTLNARGFVLQWNIGFILLVCHLSVGSVLVGSSQRRYCRPVEP